MNKKVLREMFLEKRKTLTQAEYLRRNIAIHHHINQLLSENPHKTNVHTFLSIEAQKEVNTWPLFRQLIKDPNRKVYLPKTGKNRNLSHHLMDSENDLAVNDWGIHEPINGNTVSPEILDIIFIPLICYDKRGFRIGYGGGFYDKFLAQCRANCLKIGLSLSTSLDNIDYHESFDIPLNGCINHLGFEQLPAPLQ